jgi:hypothetical protein
MPLGPIELRTALATARAAMILFEMASFPDSLRVSLKMITGVPPIPAMYNNPPANDFLGLTLNSICSSIKPFLIYWASHGCYLPPEGKRPVTLSS